MAKRSSAERGAESDPRSGAESRAESRSPAIEGASNGRSPAVEDRVARSRTQARPAFLLVATIAVAGGLAAPARALPPEGVTPDDPYVYPAGTEPAESVPSGWLRVPAAAFDLLVVRPVMAGGLAVGAGLSLVALPFQAPAAVTDDTVETLADQTKSTFLRPLGAF